MSLWSRRENDGSIFVAEERYHVEAQRDFLGYATEADLRQAFDRSWSRAVELRQPELERCIQNALLYQGFHYKNPLLNRNNVVNNLPYMLVETLWSILVENRPIPEPVPRRGARMSERRIRVLRETSKWLMDTVDFGYAYEQGTRWRTVFGWHPTTFTFDPDTGMPYPKPLSVFNYFPEPGATSEDTLEYYFVAGPVPTGWLISQFPRDRYPHLYDLNGEPKIKPDGWLSPGYEAFVQPFQEMVTGIYRGESGPSTVASVSDAGEPAATTTTKLSRPYGTIELRNAETTYLVMMFVRDRRTIEVPYTGTTIIRNPDGTKTSVPGTRSSRIEKAAPSGWACATYDAQANFYEVAPVDPAFGGAPIVIGRHVDQRPYRFEAPGVIDPIAPLVRSINKRHNALNRSLDFETTPILVRDTNSGTNVQGRTISPGQTVTKNRGAELKWLEFPGPAAEQFALLQLEHQLVDKISGSPDSQRGVKPAGVSAAAAFRELTSKADRRVNAAQASFLKEWSQVLRKLMVLMGHKLKKPLLFKGTDGEPVYVTSTDLLSQYDIAFAAGSGLSQSREELENRSAMLFQLQAIDREALLNDFDYRGRDEVNARMSQAELMDKMLAAVSAMGQNDPTDKGGGKPPGGAS